MKEIENFTPYDQIAWYLSEFKSFIAHLHEDDEYYYDCHTIIEDSIIALGFFLSNHFFFVA